MLYLTIASLVVAVIMAGIAIKQTNIAKAQTKIAQDMKAKQNEQEREVNEWQLKHESVAIQLVKITPQVTVQEPGHNSVMVLYAAIFPDPKFRQAIEHYIVQLDNTRTIFQPRRPTELDLRSPALRQTVTKAAEMLDAFRRDHPHIAASHMPL